MEVTQQIKKENIELPLSVVRSISSKWQVVIPVEIRQYFAAKYRDQIQQGDQLIFTINEKGEVLLDIMKEPDIMDLFGSLPPKEQTDKDLEQIIQEAKEERISQRMAEGSL